MSVVLMYHALYEGDDTGLIDAEDLPYAVSVEQFTQQMQLLQHRRVGLWAEGQLPDVIITFDDGHISNHDLALPILKELGLNAYFFITSDFIGQRRGFCEPVHIANLAEQGMVIGAHGQTHRFFDDLSPAEALTELQACNSALARITGSDVQSMSFPGGRFSSETLIECGKTSLKLLFGSEFGAVSSANVINRIAIRRSTNLDEFSRIINEDKQFYFTQTAKHRCKRLLKRVVGNNLYHGLYRLLSRR